MSVVDAAVATAEAMAEADAEDAELYGNEADAVDMACTNTMDTTHVIASKNDVSASVSVSNSVSSATALVAAVPPVSGTSTDTVILQRPTATFSTSVIPGFSEEDASCIDTTTTDGDISAMMNNMDDPNSTTVAAATTDIVNDDDTSSEEEESDSDDDVQVMLKMPDGKGGFAAPGQQGGLSLNLRTGEATKGGAAKLPNRRSAIHTVPGGGANGSIGGTIGGATDVNVSTASAGKLRTVGGLDMVAASLLNGKSVLDADLEIDFEEKPWRRPGADQSDYFNYGLTEEIWPHYCERQRTLRAEVQELLRSGVGSRGGTSGVANRVNMVKPGQVMGPNAPTQMMQPGMDMPRGAPLGFMVRPGFAPPPPMGGFMARPNNLPPPGMFPGGFMPNMPPSRPGEGGGPPVPTNGPPLPTGGGPPLPMGGPPLPTGGPPLPTGGPLVPTGGPPPPGWTGGPPPPTTSSAHDDDRHARRGESRGNNTNGVGDSERRSDRGDYRGDRELTEKRSNERDRERSDKRGSDRDRSERSSSDREHRKRDRDERIDERSSKRSRDRHH